MTEFERFFEREFPRLLNAAKQKGLFSDPAMCVSETSWDRRAAFLLWYALGRPGEREEFEDLLG